MLQMTSGLQLLEDLKINEFARFFGSKISFKCKIIHFYLYKAIDGVFSFTIHIICLSTMYYMYMPNIVKQGQTSVQRTFCTTVYAQVSVCFFSS
jgi:hypothetical protein